jgi:hypothetical protein
MGFVTAVGLGVTEIFCRFEGVESDRTAITVQSFDDGNGGNGGNGEIERDLLPWIAGGAVLGVAAVVITRS